MFLQLPNRRVATSFMMQPQQKKEDKGDFVRNLKDGDFSIKSFSDLAREGEYLPELRKVWGNYILEGNTVLFPSERGVGKTLLGLQIAMAVAGDESSLLGEEITLHGNTLYMNLELSEYVMKKRLSKLCKGIKPAGANYQAKAITATGYLSDLLPQIKKEIEKSKAVLVVIDNLRMAFSNRNNEKNNEMVEAIKELNLLRDKYNCAILLVHHTKKGSAHKLTNSDLQSGAGALTDLVDADFFLRKSQQGNQLRILKRVKSRNCEEQDKPKLLRLNPETLWFEVESKEVSEADHIFEPDRTSRKLQLEGAKKMRDEGKTFQEIADEFGKNKSTVSRWFKGE